MDETIKKSSSERAIEAMEKRPSIVEIVKKNGTRPPAPAKKTSKKPRTREQPSSTEKEAPLTFCLEWSRIVTLADNLKRKERDGLYQLKIGLETRKELMRLSVATDSVISLTRLVEAIVLAVCEKINK